MSVTSVNLADTGSGDVGCGKGVNDMSKRGKTSRIFLTVISIILLISMILGFVIMLVPPS
jgi:hypothetical protein